MRFCLRMHGYRINANLLLSFFRAKISLFLEKNNSYYCNIKQNNKSKLSRIISKSHAILTILFLVRKKLKICRCNCEQVFHCTFHSCKKEVVLKLSTILCILQIFPLSTRLCTDKTVALPCQIKKKNKHERSETSLSSESEKENIVESCRS